MTATASTLTHSHTLKQMHQHISAVPLEHIFKQLHDQIITQDENMAKYYYFGYIQIFLKQVFYIYLFIFCHKTKR